MAGARRPGSAGWLLASRLDVDVPDEIAPYAEGQRYVGAYVFNKILDPEAATPDHLVPQYVTILAPPGSGLPFDFDQVRVYTWSTKHHRYETAFRVHPIEGYLPVRVTQGPQRRAHLQLSNRRRNQFDHRSRDRHHPPHRPAHHYL